MEDTVLTVCLAGLLFCGAHILRIGRLVVWLGSYRLPFLTLAMLHCLGVSVSYGIFPFLAYEVILLGGCFLYRKDAFIPVCYALVLLRLFDAVSLGGLLLCFSETNREYVAVMGGIILVCWFCLTALPPLLYRVEKKLLVLSGGASWEVPLLRMTHSFRKSLDKLNWGYKGTVLLTFLLSACSWILEGSAVALLSPSLSSAADVVFQRAIGGFSAIHPPAYDFLAPILYVISGLTFLAFIVMRVKRHG